MTDLSRHAVTRWHQNPWPTLRNSGDCTHAHSARVALLILHLWPDASRDLLIAALIHDDAEGGPGGTGDVSGPCKVGAYGRAIAERQAEVERARGLDKLLDALTADDAARLAYADRLDALRWVEMVEPRALSSDGWPECRAWLEREGQRLGVAEALGASLGAQPTPAVHIAPRDDKTGVTEQKTRG